MELKLVLMPSQLLDVGIPQRSPANNEGELHSPVSHYSYQWKRSRHASFVKHSASVFWHMKALRGISTPPECDACPLQGYPKILLGNPKTSPVAMYILMGEGHNCSSSRNFVILTFLQCRSCYRFGAVVCFIVLSRGSEPLIWELASLVSCFPWFRSVFFFREGDLRVIRPFVYVREKELRRFAEKVTASSFFLLSFSFFFFFFLSFLFFFSRIQLLSSAQKAECSCRLQIPWISSKIVRCASHFQLVSFLWPIFFELTCVFLL